MDFFQRAATFFDRAQDRFLDAPNNAPRPMLSSTEMRSLEARQAYLRQQLEHASMELGKLTYQRWKNRGVGNDGAMAVLCQQIDALNVEYQQVLGALTDARTPPNGRRPAPPAPSPYPPLGYPAASPPTAPYRPQAQNGYPPHATSSTGAAPGTLPSSPMPAQLPFPPVGHSQLGPVVTPLPTAPSRPPRPPKPTRECPECYTMVPGDVDFCPSCGMRV
jgi:hypothetical protein